MKALLTVLLTLTAVADLEDAESIRTRARAAVGVQQVESSLELPADATPATKNN